MTQGHRLMLFTGKATSLNRARQAAYASGKGSCIANIAEAVKSLRVDPQNQFEDVMKTMMLPEKLFQIKLTIPWSAENIRRDSTPQSAKSKLYFGSVIASLQYNFPADDFPVRAEIPIATPYSSLIIDCRGLDIKPMLFPSIYGDNGLEIYGKNFIDSVSAAKGGVVSYCYNENQAQLDRRAGEHPYLTVAMKSLKNCPILLEKDVRKILSSPDTINNLKKCKVIFIIDKS